MDVLRKAYIEPTNACNLNCRTCVRHAWDEPEGFMAWDAYEAIVDGLVEATHGSDRSEAGAVAFMGLGEPLLHPRFLDMVRLAKERGLRTEVTTNALLLDKELAAGLLAAGLDQLVVSIDGASAESFGRVRSGASLERVVHNVRLPHDRRGPYYGCGTRIGIEFVAMRSNIAELPGLNRLAAQIGSVVRHRQQRARLHAAISSRRPSSTATVTVWRDVRAVRRPTGGCPISTGTRPSARRSDRRWPVPPSVGFAGQIERDTATTAPS